MVPGWWEGEDVTEGAGGGVIFTPPGGGGRIPPDDGRGFGLFATSLPSFFCKKCCHYCVSNNCDELAVS